MSSVPGGDPDDGDDPRVCYCMRVSEGQLRRAIAAGATTLAALQERTGAGTGCGTCRIDLLQLLAALGHVDPAAGPWR